MRFPCFFLLRVGRPPANADGSGFLFIYLIAIDDYTVAAGDKASVRALCGIVSKELGAHYGRRVAVVDSRADFSTRSLWYLCAYVSVK